MFFQRGQHYGSFLVPGQMDYYLTSGVAYQDPGRDIRCTCGCLNTHLNQNSLCTLLQFYSFVNIQFSIQ